MFRLLRTAASLLIMSLALWAAFAVDLGGRSFAEHIDTISETPEAEQLIDGTRSKINPALQELRDRVLGEYVEAPTWISAEPGAQPSPRAAQPSPSEPDAKPDRRVPASTLEPQAARYEPSLPGRSRDLQTHRGPDHEPALPGRR